VITIIDKDMSVNLLNNAGDFKGDITIGMLIIRNYCIIGHPERPPSCFGAVAAIWLLPAKVRPDVATF
jgi:hypothetical protein